MNAESLLIALGRSSLQAGMLVLLVLAVQWLLRKQLTPRWRAALWLLVVIRLLLPFTLGSAASIFNLLPRLEKEAATPAPIQPVPAATELAVPRLPLPPPPVARFAPVPPEPSLPVEGVDAHDKDRPVAQSISPEPNPTAASALPPVIKASWITILFWIWVAGVALLGGYVAVCAACLSWRCRHLSPLTDANVLAVLEECARRMGVRRKPVIVESGDVTSPALFGLWRPRLILPAGFIHNFSTQELRFVFLHELAHLRRRDLALNWLVTVLQVIHWFNPLLWLGFARWRADRELACDALALETAGGDHNREYGRTILRLLENFTHRAPAPGLVGILEDKRQLKRRISMIASFRPGRRWGVVSVMVVFVLAVIGLTDAQTSKTSKPDTTDAKSSIATDASTKDRDSRVGEDPLPELPAADAEIRTLTVNVLDPDGKPLSNAEVNVPYLGDWNKPKPKRLTGADGRFVVRFPIPPKEQRQRMSNFSVSASHLEYAARAVMWTAAGGDVYAGMPGEVSIKLTRGSTIGGAVQDERGQPLEGVRVLLSGSGYRGFTLGNDERREHEYTELWKNDLKSPAAITDTSGRWSFAQFAPDIKQLQITFVRPDGARETYATSDEPGLNQYPLLSLAELEKNAATVRLPDGITVRGLVTDENGKPLEGVKVREGYGHGNTVRVGEFTTDANGRFERLHRAPRQWIYTAEHPDRATVSIVARVEPGMKEVRLVMPPPRPWRIEVVDSEGRPVADAEITVDSYRTEAQLLDWKGNADATGILVWSNPPTDAVTFIARWKAPVAYRKFTIAPTETGKRVVLDPRATEKITVRLKAVDAKTRQPVKLKSVALQYNGDFRFRTLAEPDATEFTTELKLSDVKVGMAPSYQFKVDADDYVTLTTEYQDFEQGDQELELALTRLREADSLVVRQPDGSPAAGARMWARTTSDGGTLFINDRNRIYGDRLEKTEADEHGQLKLSGAPADAPVVIAHSNGFFAGKMSDLRGRSELPLQPYGAVEGRLLVAGQPKGGVQVSLNTLSWSPALAFHLGLTATTDSDGRFTFTQVPPGEFKLYRWMLPKRRDTSGQPITETYQWPVTVLPGRTNTIEYSFTGRPMIGQAVPQPADLAVDWQRDVHTLNLKLPTASAHPRRVNREDYATFAAFQKANNASMSSDAQLQAAREARAYALDIEPDGSFRIEDVPPGTYELRIRVTRPNEGGRRTAFGDGEEIGSLIREVVVPDGKEPLDLGTLPVPMREGAPVKANPPVALKAITLDGQPLDLAQFKGTNVLLVFWASWSDRSREQLAALKELQSQFAGEPQLAVVGLSLDENIEKARATVAKLNCPGVQGWLDAEGRARAAASFDLNILPDVFLLDTEGRIIARELEGERLPATVKRTLAKR